MYATLHNATDTFEAVTDLVDEVMAHSTELLLLLLGAGPTTSLGQSIYYIEIVSMKNILVYDATRIQLILSTFSNIVNEKRR